MTDDDSARLDDAIRALNNLSTATNGLASGVTSMVDIMLAIGVILPRLLAQLQAAGLLDADALAADMLGHLERVEASEPAKDLARAWLQGEPAKALPQLRLILGGKDAEAPAS